MSSTSKPTATSGHPEIIVSESKPYQKNTLLGFLSLRLLGGIIRNVCLHERNMYRATKEPAAPPPTLSLLCQAPAPGR